ncbi:MAG TPA: hypothetical protein VE172_16480 [Stackebrandtia sp.]|uniref:CG0192-related protein n=1 Tax=Stackebrandtia sp. TaxID=2023065 RepID=UPI002D488A56|nr:hypothetical protein [Stackebrandtia sp.]HZE40399.1 hypothetical protein [Stackebrandtia sp.]
MALIHKATLRPTKLELLADWLPGRDWYTGTAGEVSRVNTFRFDDPDGAVGIETMLVRVGDGPVHQVPLTYREAPLDGGDEWLLGTADHSVLGERWIYDGVGDPVYVAALASAILGNTGQAEQFIEVDGRLDPRELSMSIASSAGSKTAVPDVGAIQHVTGGDPTVIVTDAVELAVVRRLDVGSELDGVVLTGSWSGPSTPWPLASATVRHHPQ